MKKLLALALCLMMAFCMVSAVAEEETEILAAEMLFDGVWVQFEDGFEFYLPSNWYQVEEIPQEWIEMGVFYAACTEDMAYNVTLEWHPIEEGTSMGMLYDAVSETSPDAGIALVNGVELLAYTNFENNQMTYIAMDGAEPGIYCFVFTPADDPDFQNLAALIASTIRNIPA